MLASLLVTSLLCSVQAKEPECDEEAAGKISAESKRAVFVQIGDQVPALTPTEIEVEPGQVHVVVLGARSRRQPGFVLEEFDVDVPPGGTVRVSLQTTKQWYLGARVNRRLAKRCRKSLAEAALVEPVASAESAASAKGRRVKLEIGSKPFAHVWLDGKKLKNTTPLIGSRAVRVKPGPHTLRLKSGQGDGALNIEIDIECCDTVRVIAVLPGTGKKPEVIVKQGTASVDWSEPERR